MKLIVVTFGKLKNPGLREAADYFKKILTPWQSLEEIELKQASPPDPKADQETLEAWFDSKTGMRARLILLDETGKGRTSTEWADLIQKNQAESVTELVFCIGSATGFSNAVKERAAALCSLGPQTLSHELARVVLFEQLYRAYSIIKGHPYHNA